MKFFLYLFILNFNFLYAQISELHSMNDLHNYVDNQTLVLIDFDNCLFQSSTCFGHNYWFADYVYENLQMKKNIREAVEEFYPRWILSQKYCEVEFLESCSKESINKIQENGIQIIGFTHRRDTVSFHTLGQLKNIGLSFEKTTPIKKPIYLSYKNDPKFIEGVLFINDFNEKGEILPEFFKHLPSLPQKIVAVDDTLSHLKSVEKALKDFPITFIGLHYRKCEKFKNKWDKRIAQIQEKLCGKVLSNKAAKELLQNP